MFRTALLFCLFGAFGVGASAQLPDVMYLKFNEGSGTTTADFAVPGVGTALFDLKMATNGNGLGVSSLQNGPFGANASSGGPLVFAFEDEANRPLALLIGPLNPVAATYPNVGQLDIGGVVDPITGIPTSIQVLGDGFNPADFFDILISTGSSGQLTMNFVAPTLPPGVIGTFQALFSTGNGFFFAIFNAVELTII